MIPTQPDRESLDIQALQDKALELWMVDQTSALELGRALIAVRNAMRAHGAFAKWWRAAGMDENRVYYCIRKAEGKEEHTAQVPPVTLTARNLELAKLAPKCDGKFTSSTVHVGPRGTTVADGFVLARVSLPRCSNVPQADALLPPAFALRVAGDLELGAAAEVRFGKDSIRATTDAGISIADAPGSSVFPKGTDELLAPKPAVLSGTICIAPLLALVNAVNNFLPPPSGAEERQRQTVVLSISEGFVRIEADANGQHFVGVVMHKMAGPEPAE